MTSPFDYVNAITFTKKHMMKDTGNDQLAESQYVAYMVNKALSYFPDTLLYANHMNIHHELDNRLQFDYLINTVRPKKRFSKWVKRQDDSDIEAIKQYYGYNNRNAQRALTLLSPEQIKTIKTRLNTGGRLK